MALAAAEKFLSDFDVFNILSSAAIHAPLVFFVAVPQRILDASDDVLTPSGRFFHFAARIPGGAFNSVFIHGGTLVARLGCLINGTRSAKFLKLER